MSRTGVAVVVLTILVGACSSGSNGSGAGEGGPGGVVAEGGSDGSAWTPCATPVADACDGGSAAPGVQCIPSLADACGYGALITGVTTCGAFVELSYGRGVDTSTYEVYDATSKQLVAIIEYVGVLCRWVCVAGPPGFVLPKCSGATTLLACSDAGDASTPGDATDSGP